MISSEQALDDFMLKVFPNVVPNSQQYEATKLIWFSGRHEILTCLLSSIKHIDDQDELLEHLGETLNKMTKQSYEYINNKVTKDGK